MTFVNNKAILRVASYSFLMVYRHQYFTLEPKSKRVFDENNKELRLTGNAYRMLVFLCESKNANLTDIGALFDWAKDYDENHIRQYKYKINTIIGHDIIEYKNNTYSLIGEIEKTSKPQPCNTTLLQENNIQLEKDIVNKKTMKPTPIPAVIAIILLLLTFLDWPYGYYNFLRIAVTVIAIYYAYSVYQIFNKLNVWFWILGVIVILFNPIFPVYLGDKTIWGIIDIIVAIFFVGLIIRLKNERKN